MFVPVLIATVLLAESAPQAEEGPRAAIELYFQAHALGRGAYIKRAFSPDASIKFMDAGQPKLWNTDEFAKRFQQPAIDEYRRVRRVESLTISGSAASAVVKLNYPEVEFTDHLSLLRIGDEWKIVGKVFYANHRRIGETAVKEILQEWARPFPPRKVAGNIYYVGSNLISSFLITTPAGHILLDTGPVEMLPLVEQNIRTLGFDPKQVKLLLNSHAHFDHCGGFAEFRRRAGASVLASRADGELMSSGGKNDFAWGDDLAYEPVKPDRIIEDNESIELGGVRLTAHLTPGHTKGCTTWSMRTTEDGKDLNVLFACGFTVSPYKLTNNDRYPSLVADERNTLKKLRGMHADVMLAPHGFYFDLQGKASRQKPGAPNPFIDPGELALHLDEMEKDLENALGAQERQRDAATASTSAK